MFGKIIMHVVLALLAGLVPLLVVAWLHENGIRPFAVIFGWVRRLTWPARLLLFGFAVNVIVWGSTKDSTNSPPGGVNGIPPGGLMSRSAEEPVDSPRGVSEFTPAERASGFVQTWIRTNEVWNFNAPADAGEVPEWRLRGATCDWYGLSGTNLPRYVFASGHLQDGLRNPQLVHAPLHGVLGVVPEANWARIDGSNATSRVWFREDDAGDAWVTWQDVLLGRGSENPVNVQALFHENGEFVYRYDLSRADEDLLDATWIGAAQGGATASVARVEGTHEVVCGGTTSALQRVTSMGWYRLSPEDFETADRDGDGLPTRDEVCVHGTDPGLADTDGDGVCDGDEVARGLSPTTADSDGDGFVDGSDPDPLTATSREDRDDDGLPDAYENHWFGGTNVVDRADERDETGFTLSGKLMAGLDPTKAPSACMVVSTNQLVCWKLWDGFSAQWNPAETNLLFERTVRIRRSHALQQYFLSSRPDAAGAWRLVGMQLEVAWSAGGETESVTRGLTATASPHGDSLRLPLAEELPDVVTFRLRATGPSPRSVSPVYLVAYAPAVRIGGEEILLPDGSTAHVFTQGSESEIAVSIDHSKRPCRAPLSEEERDLSGLRGLLDGVSGGLRYEGTESVGRLYVDGPGIYLLPSFGVAVVPSHPARLLRSGSSDGGVDCLVVLLPSIGWSGNHSYGCANDVWWDDDWYSVESTYPLDSVCIRRGWFHDADGGSSCDCQPYVSSGVEDDCPYVSVTCTGEDGRATGSVAVGGQTVWSGQAEHSWNWSCGDGWLDGGIESEDCESCSGCEDGNCDSNEGVTIESLKFRIPLGSPRKGQFSGFLYFDTDTPVDVTLSLFQLLARADAVVSETSTETTRTVVCSDSRGRTLSLAEVPHGVRITITTTATGALEHTWELVNVDGARDVVRIRKISRLDNVMEDWTVAYVRNSATDDWEWQATDNVAGVREELVVDDQINGASREYRETRNKYALDGSWLGCIERRSELVGEGEACVLRETCYRESSYGRNVERRADYWRDTEHRARNGKARLLTGDDRPWEYHVWTENGYERLRLVQRDGSAVPESFPEVDTNGVPCALSAVSNAFLTVFDYALLPGDAGHPDENGRVRSETQYVVRDGVATCIAQVWHRYAHVTAGGLPAVTCETWRACRPTADWNDPGNASSYVVTFSESGEDAVPRVVRGDVAEELDEDGVRSVTTVSVAADQVVSTTRRSRDGVAFSTYEVVARDPTYGVVLRRATCLTADDSVVDEQTNVYDDQNRLRARTFRDGTSLTNSYSCCRLLWSRDQKGRTVHRSAVTGQDHLYWAEEERWLADPRLRAASAATNGGFRTTQHFCDSFGRETNRITYVAATAGEAVARTASDGAPRLEERTEFQGLGEENFTRTDIRGKMTFFFTGHDDDRDVAFEETSDGVRSAYEERVEIRNGRRSVRKHWDNAQTETTTETDYDAAGLKTVVETTASADYGTVTNRVVEYDFLGRRLRETTSEGATVHLYRGAAGVRTGTVYTAGYVSRATEILHDARGAEVGTEVNGVVDRTDETDEPWNGNWWHVERHVVCTNGFTNVLEVTRRQLTGLEDNTLSRVVRESLDGMWRETVTTHNDDGTETVTENDARGGVTTTVNLFGLALSRTTAEGTWRYAYDAMGRQVGETRTVGEEMRPVREMSYALTGDLSALTVYTNAVDGVMEAYAYDRFGNRTAVTNALGEAILSTFDARGNVVAEDGASYPVRYAFDTEGRRTAFRTTRDGAVWDETARTYEPGTGRVTSRRRADSSQSFYTYTPDGLLERTLLASGRWRENVYDGVRNRIATLSSDGTADARFAYDAFGGMLAESNAVFAARYVRAPGGMVTNETLGVSGHDGETVWATYRRERDACGRIAGRGFAGGTWQTVTYTAQDRIAALAAPDATVTYAYGADGSELGYTVAVAGGVTVRRMVVRDPYRGWTTAVSNWAGTVCLNSFRLGYDVLGRIVSRNGDSFAYNARSELTACTAALPGSSATAAYAYDAIGNFASVTRGGVTTAYAANAVNRYEGLSYTADGELAAYGDATFEYDAAGRLTSVSTGGVVAAEYAYDPSGRRVRATTAEGVRMCFYDGWNLVREVVEQATGGTVTNEYFWGRDLSGALDGAGGVGGLLYAKLNGAVYVPLYDAGGNVVAYVNAAGAVVATFEYDAFGNTIAATGAQADDFRFRYSTKYFDRETGLIYYTQRYYNPPQGRWLTEDPLEEQGGLNLYAFCGNDGVNEIDILGTLNAITAFLHYLGRSEKEESVKFDIVDTSMIRANDFKQVHDIMKSCKKGEYEINDSLVLNTISTSLNVGLMLGQITIKIEGTMPILQNGDWKLNGRLFAAQDKYDFNKGDRSWWAEALTTIGRNLPGKIYEITIEGEKSFFDSGNCCNSRGEMSMLR